MFRGAVLKRMNSSTRIDKEFGESSPLSFADLCGHTLNIHSSYSGSLIIILSLWELSTGSRKCMLRESEHKDGYERSDEKKEKISYE
jgi:hypothetical protein